MEEYFKFKLKPEQIRSEPGYEDLSDEEVNNLIETLYQLSVIAYRSYTKDEFKIKNFRYIHEAAHAVAAYHFNVPFESISGDYPFEKVDYTPTPKELKSKLARVRTSAIVKRLIRVDYAGTYAERKYFGKVDADYCKDDIESIKKNAIYLTGKKNKAIMDCYRSVSRLFGRLSVSGEEDSNKNWQTVLEVARVLEKQKELNYHDAIKIIVARAERGKKRPHI